MIIDLYSFPFYILRTKIDSDLSRLLSIFRVSMDGGEKVTRLKRVKLGKGDPEVLITDRLVRLNTPERG